MLCDRICSCINKKLLRSAHPLKEEMVDCLDEMIERNIEDGKEWNFVKLKLREGNRMHCPKT